MEFTWPAFRTFITWVYEEEGHYGHLSESDDELYIDFPVTPKHLEKFVSLCDDYGKNS